MWQDGGGDGSKKMMDSARQTCAWPFWRFQPLWRLPFRDSCPPSFNSIGSVVAPCSPLEINHVGLFSSPESQALVVACLCISSLIL